MNSTLKKIGPSQIEVFVELVKEDLDKYVAAAENELSKDIEMDGFRKGKVPKDILRDKLGAEKILESAMQVAIKSSLAEIVKEQKLDVLDTSDFKINENTPKKLTYQVSLTVFPEVKLGDFSSLKLKPKEVIVSKKEIDDTLETVKASRANLLEKSGPAETGDRVEVDFEVSMGDKILEDGVSKNHPLIIGGKNFMPGFEENLVGMKKSEEKKFSLKAPEDYFKKDIAGQKLDFTVKLNDVKSVQMPELNDDFAKNVGRFDNLKQLLDNIEEGIRQEKVRGERQRARLEILGHIIKVSQIEIPKVMVDRQLDVMVQSFDENLHKNGLEIGPYLAHLGKTQDDLKRDWEKEAEKQVKITLVLHKIAKDRNIAVSPEELEKQTNIIVQEMILREGVDIKNLNIEAIREGIAASILNEKTLQSLEQSCSA